MKQKNIIIISILIGVFICLSIFISINVGDRLSKLFIGINIAVLIYIFIVSKTVYNDFLNKDFIDFTKQILNKLKVVGFILYPKKIILADYLLFLPNKVILFYVTDYKGTIYIDENIYDEQRNILKNITKVKNNALLDTKNLMLYYIQYKQENFDYNDFEIVTVCYAYNADILQTFNHNIVFADRKNIKNIINYNVSVDNKVYPYKEYIQFLKNKNILS